MAKPQESHRSNPSGVKEWDRRVVHLTTSVYPKDMELLQWIQEHLGTSQAEAIRTAIRLCATQLAQVPLPKIGVTSE